MSQKKSLLKVSKNTCSNAKRKIKQVDAGENNLPVLGVVGEKLQNT